jgi:hypothetical protein
MKWLAYLVAFAIGALAIILPLLLGWNPELMKTSIGFGIGVIIATIYALVRRTPAVAAVGAVADEPGVTVNFGDMAWYDWLVMIGCVVGGFLIGSLA